MNLQCGSAPALRRCSRTFIRRHFHTVHELSRIEINEHPPQRQSFERRECRKLWCPSHVLNHNTPQQKKRFSDRFSKFSYILTPMTLIHRVSETKVEKMDGSSKEDVKSLRPVRNRRHTRRCLVAGQRPQKRLFTPEIKRYLKDWLVRRRENPYPNREEKKHLSRETGLTYIQICNWFANWRRKLKNVNADKNQLTWGHLIRTYNDRAQGNVEQFSICSDDSIWSEPGRSSPDHESLIIGNRLENSSEREMLFKEDDTDGSSISHEKYESFNNNSNEIERCEKGECDGKTITSPVLLSKWLESAARFQPSETNYSWWAEGKRRKPESKIRLSINTVRHGRDEVEAAVALTALASATNRITAP